MPHAVFALATLHLLSFQLGGWTPDTYRVLGVLVFASWLLLRRAEVRFAGLLGFPGIWLVAGLVLVARGESRLVCTTGAVLLLGAAAGVLRIDPALRRALACTGPLYLVLSIGHLVVPAAFAPLRAAAAAWSGALGDIALGHELDLGPTLLGYWFALAWGCLVAARFALAEWRPRRLAAGFAMLLGVHLILLLLTDLATSGAIPRAAIPWVPAGYFVLAALPVAWLVSIPGPVATTPTSARPVLAWAAAATVTLAVVAATPLVAARDRPAILFYSVDEGALADGAILNWDKPVWGRYGPYSGGMFGLLPEYLRAEGCRVGFLRTRVRPTALVGVDAFVVINAATDWSADELQTVWTWVKQGGSLLVLGDHTDVAGTRQSLNSLLTPVGIRFQYDAAVPAARGWADADLFTHPMHAGIASGADLGIGVGASLALTKAGAVPIVVARLGLADLGSLEREYRAFLGDYAYQSGEALGDLVLAAWARYGQGRITVFGDTSQFQNIALAHTWEPHVRQVFAWACGEVVFDPGWLARLLLGAGFVGCALAALWTARGREPLVPLLSVLFLGVMLGAQSLHAVRRSEQSPGMRRALIDLSHGARVDSSPRGENDLSALVTCLQRSGYAVDLCEAWDRDRLARAQVFVTIAPVTPYEPDEAVAIHEFLSAGGLVLAAVGHPDKGPLEGLLRRVDLDLGSRVVGPVPLRRWPGRDRTRVEFIEAWPVVVPTGDAADVQVLGAYDDLPLAVRKRVGNGGICLAGDSRFFGSKNLEDMDGHSLPNLELLERMLASAGGGGGR